MSPWHVSSLPPEWQKVADSVDRLVLRVEKLESRVEMHLPGDAWSFSIDIREERAPLKQQIGELRNRFGALLEVLGYEAHQQSARWVATKTKKPKQKP